MYHEKVFFRACFICRFVLALLATGICCTADDETPKGRIPSPLIDGINIVLKEKAPGFKTEWTEVDDVPWRIEYTYKCQTYQFHHRMGKSDTLKEQSSPVIAPSADGFSLTIRWSSDAGTSRASGGGGGPDVPSAYSKVYSNFYALADDGGFVEVIFDYGPLTDMTILDSVLAQISLLGKPVYEFRREGWEARSARLQNELTELVRKYEPEAEWRTDDQILICEFNTMEFDIHFVDDDGIVSTETHRETGPLHDGFIIRLRPVNKPARCQPLTMQSVVYGPYWQTQFAIYDLYGEPFRLEVLHVGKSDKVLWTLVTNELDELFSPCMLDSMEFFQDQNVLGRH